MYVYKQQNLVLLALKEIVSIKESKGFSIKTLDGVLTISTAMIFITKIDFGNSTGDSC